MLASSLLISDDLHSYLDAGLRAAVCALDVTAARDEIKLSTRNLLFAELCAAYWHLDPLLEFLWRPSASGARFDSRHQHRPQLLRLYACYGARNTTHPPVWFPRNLPPFRLPTSERLLALATAEALLHSGHTELFRAAFPGAHLSVSVAVSGSLGMGLYLRLCLSVSVFVCVSYLYVCSVYSDLYGVAYPYLASRSPPVCAPAATFHAAFDAFTHGLFRNFPWAELRAVVAGGAVAAPLLSAGGAAAEMERTFTTQGFEASDIDLFLLSDPSATREQRTERVRAVA